MLPIIANATAADWRKFTAAVIRDAIAHGIPADLAEDVAQAAALRLLNRSKPLPEPRSGEQADMPFVTALTKGQGRKRGYRSFLGDQRGSRMKDPGEAFKVASRRASRHVPDPAEIAERAERPYRLAATEYYRDRMTAEGLCDSAAILAAYGVGPQALAEPGCTPDVVRDMGHTPPQVTRGVPAQDGDGTAVRTVPFDLETEYARAAANREQPRQPAEDRPWWMN